MTYGLNLKEWIEGSQVIKGGWGYLMGGMSMCEVSQGDKSLIHAGNDKSFRMKWWSVKGQAERDKQRGSITKKFVCHPKGFGFYAAGNGELLKHFRQEIVKFRAAS